MLAAPHRLRPHRAFHLEGRARLLHLHRVRALLGQLPGAHDRQDPEPQAPHARSSRSPLPPPRGVPRARSAPARRAPAKATRRRPSRERVEQRQRASAARRARPRHGPRRRRERPEPSPTYKPVDLVPNVIHEDVLWALHDLPRLRGAVPGDDHLRRQDRADAPQPGDDPRREFPAELNKPFQGMETNGNPWNLVARRPRQLGRGPRRADDGREARRPRSCTGSAAPRATTIAPRRSPAPPRSC